MSADSLTSLSPVFTRETSLLCGRGGRLRGWGRASAVPCQRRSASDGRQPSRSSLCIELCFTRNLKSVGQARRERRGPGLIPGPWRVVTCHVKEDRPQTEG